MGFRYRKSINLGGGFRINLSKSGIGYSWGVRGYRVTKPQKELHARRHQFRVLEFHMFTKLERQIIVRHSEILIPDSNPFRLLTTIIMTHKTL